MISLRRRWMLALGALAHHCKGRSHVRLGGLARTWQNQVKAATELLKEWSVRAPEDSQRVLTFLANEGYRHEASTAAAVWRGAPSKKGADANGRAEAALTAYDTAALVLSAGRAALIGHITEEEAWSVLEGSAVLAQKRFRSFAHFGANLLEGEALRTGVWDPKKEVAYHELLTLADSPWCAIPWDADLGADTVGAVSQHQLDVLEITAFFECPICKERCPVHVLDWDVPCAGCGVVFEPPRDGWLDALADTFDKVRGMPPGHVYTLVDVGRAYSTSARWKHLPLACVCGADLDPAALLASEQNEIACTVCQAPFGRPRADGWTYALHPEIVAIQGEHERGGSGRHEGASAFVVACTGCGAPLRPDGERRTVTCVHCRKVESLSDEAWRIVRPPSPAPRLRVILAGLMSKPGPSR